jgi:hypothetical protein
MYKGKIKKNTCKSRTAKNYCEKCGFRIRGKNHETGDHHIKGKDGKCDISGY